MTAANAQNQRGFRMYVSLRAGPLLHPHALGVPEGLDQRALQSVQQSSTAFVICVSDDRRMVVDDAILLSANEIPPTRFEFPLANKMATCALSLFHHRRTGSTNLQQ